MKMMETTQSVGLGGSKDLAHMHKEFREVMVSPSTIFFQVCVAMLPGITTIWVGNHKLHSEMNSLIIKSHGTLHHII